MNTHDTLARLRRQSADPARRILFAGATIVTMDPELGTLQGDLLVEGDTIAAIGANLTADGAVVVDATGTPGRRSCGGSCPTSTTSAAM